MSYTGATGAMIKHRYGSAPLSSQVADTVIDEMSFGVLMDDPRLTDTRLTDTRTADSRAGRHTKTSSTYGMYDALSGSVADSMFGQPEDFGMLDYIAYDPEDEEDEDLYDIDMEVDIDEDADEEAMGYSPDDTYGAFWHSKEKRAEIKRAKAERAAAHGHTVRAARLGARAEQLESGLSRRQFQKQAAEEYQQQAQTSPIPGVTGIARSGIPTMVAQPMAAPPLSRTDRLIASRARSAMGLPLNPEAHLAQLRHKIEILKNRERQGTLGPAGQAKLQQLKEIRRNLRQKLGLKTRYGYSPDDTYGLSRMDLFGTTIRPLPSQTPSQGGAAAALDLARYLQSKSVYAVPQEGRAIGGVIGQNNAGAYFIEVVADDTMSVPADELRKRMSYLAAKHSLNKHYPELIPNMSLNQDMAPATWILSFRTK